MTALAYTGGQAGPANFRSRLFAGSKRLALDVPLTLLAVTDEISNNDCGVTDATKGNLGVGGGAGRCPPCCRGCAHSKAVQDARVKID
jgi:hypothetical protein